MIKGLVKNKYVFVYCVCIVFLAMLFVFNSITKKGHDVYYAGGLVDGALLTNYGYVQEWNYFVKAVDDAYLTFKHDSQASEFSIFFQKPAERDIRVYVWLMEPDGYVRYEFETTWKEGEYYMEFVDIPDGISLVSLSIDGNFTFYKVISSNPYHYWVKAASLSLVTGFIVLIILLIFCRLGIIKRFCDYIKRIIGLITWKRVVVIFGGIAGSFLLSCLTVYILYSFGVVITGHLVEVNWKTVILFTMFFFYVHAIAWNRKRLVRKLAFFGGFTVLMVSSAYALLETPCTGISWDDQIHYSDATYYSHLVGREKNIAEDFMVYGYELTYFDKENSEYVAGMFDALYKQKYFYVMEDYKVGLKLLVYLPNSLGMSLARGLGLPFRYHILMARFMMALFAAVMCYAAMSILEYGQLVLLMMLVTPMNVFLFGNISYDPWVIMWVVFGFALIFKGMQSDDKISLRTAVLIGVSFWLASLVKQVYCVLVLPAFFMPRRKFRSKRNAWAFRIIMFGSMMLTFGPMVFSHLFRAGDGDARGGAGVSSFGQVDYIMANPLEFAKMLLSFLKDYLNPLKFGGMNSCIELVGYNRVGRVAGIVMMLILAAALVCHGDSRHGFKADSDGGELDETVLNKIVSWFGSFPLWYRLGMLVLYAGIGAICATAMYISFTPVGADAVQGCQGRYLIPVLFPTVYVLTRVAVPEKLLLKIKAENFYMMMMYAMVTINMCVALKEYVVWY